jgi:hypothetical protein
MLNRLHTSVVATHNNAVKSQSHDPAQRINTLTNDQYPYAMWLYSLSVSNSLKQYKRSLLSGRPSHFVWRGRGVNICPKQKLVVQREAPILGLSALHMYSIRVQG